MAIKAMRVHVLTWHDPSNGCILEWYSSKGEAEKARTVRRREYRDADKLLNADGELVDPPVPEFAIEPRNVPRAKRELLFWLNQNLRTDNG